jgi:hypothetical protein
MAMSLNSKFIYAEQWLAEAFNYMTPLFSSKGYRMPDVRILYGFSTDGYDHRKKRQYLGECLSSSFTQDGQVIVLITPIRSYGVDILSILGHELVHAVDNCNDGHGEVFKRISTGVGYEFINGVDVPTRSLRERLKEFSFQLGAFPGVKLKNFSI